MRINKFEPVYDVTIEQFNPGGQFEEPAIMGRVAIHGFNSKADRFIQIIEVLDKICGQYENPVVRRLPRSKVKRLPPFYRVGAGEGVPRNATPCHEDIDLGHSWLREPMGVFFLQSQLPFEVRPHWQIDPID